MKIYGFQSLVFRCGLTLLVWGADRFFGILQGSYEAFVLIGTNPDFLPVNLFCFWNFNSFGVAQILFFLL